jgi:hypothetical protein
MHGAVLESLLFSVNKLDSNITGELQVENGAKCKG